MSERPFTHGVRQSARQLFSPYENWWQTMVGAILPARSGCVGRARKPPRHIAVPPGRPAWGTAVCTSRRHQVRARLGWWSSEGRGGEEGVEQVSMRGGGGVWVGSGEDVGCRGVGDDAQVGAVARQHDAGAAEVGAEGVGVAVPG